MRPLLLWSVSVLTCREETTPLLSFPLRRRQLALKARPSWRGGGTREVVWELIDHVERLHAEKHKLEDRVARAEQHAQVGEGIEV